MGLEIISLLKKKLGLTTQELSEMSGVPVGTLNKILNGTTQDPKLETLKALARVLGCTLDDFGDKNQTSKQKIIVSIFEKLNEIGKNEAIKRVEELACIDKYINNNQHTNFSNLNSCVAEDEPEYLAPKAAHADNLTDKEKEEANKLFDEFYNECK